jgi:hypothetical protein
MALFDTTANIQAAGYEGLLIDAPPGGVESYVAQAAVRAGFAVAYGADMATTRRQVIPIPAAAAAYPADVDAIAGQFAPIASAVAPQRLTAVAALDGVIGIERIYPARPVTFDWNADAGWDTLIGFLLCTVYGEDAEGNPISEDVIRNNAGAVAVAVETRQCFSRVHTLDIGASNAATGTCTVGVAPTRIEYSELDLPGVALYNVAREPSAVAAVTFDALETLAVCHRGLVWAVAVDAVVPGDIVTVRIAAGGGGLGSLSGTEPFPAGGNFAKLLNAHWATAAAAGGLAKISLGGF